MLGCYQRHVVRYHLLKNLKICLLTKLFEITGHSYPSLFVIRHGESIGTSFGAIGDQNLQKRAGKGCYDTFLAVLWPILRVKIYNRFGPSWGLD